MSRKKIITDLLQHTALQFDLSALTNEQLDDLEAIMKRNGVDYISVEKAVEQGFVVPDDPNKILSNLIKFYKNENH